LPQTRPPRLSRQQKKLGMYYTYVLISQKDSKFYIGYTSNLKKRFREHNEGKVSSTTSRLPLKLIYYEACINEFDAKKRERYFKSGYGRRFLHNRLEKYFEESS
jgi:putative endonuclease